MTKKTKPAPPSKEPTKQPMPTLARIKEVAKYLRELEKRELEKKRLH